MSTMEQTAKSRMIELMERLQETEQARETLAKELYDQSTAGNLPINAKLNRVIHAIATTMTLPADSWLVGQTAAAVMRAMRDPALEQKP